MGRTSPHRSPAVKTHLTTIQISPEMHTVLRQRAKKERRLLYGLVDHLLTLGIEAERRSFFASEVSRDVPQTGGEVAP